MQTTTYNIIEEKAPHKERTPLQHNSDKFEENNRKLREPPKLKNHNLKIKSHPNDKSHSTRPQQNHLTLGKDESATCQPRIAKAVALLL